MDIGSHAPSDPFGNAGPPTLPVPLDYKETRNCANGSPRITLRRANPDGTVDLLVAFCDRWTCPRCAPRQRNRLVDKVTFVVREHRLFQWLHLTLRYDTAPCPDRDAKKLLKKWAALRTLYAKHHGRKLPYVWFKHIENGRPHLHIFTRDLDIRWVEREWRKRTGAWQIKLQDIDPDTMPTPAWYATRLISENAVEYGKSCGRWWGKSQGIDIDLRERSKGDSEWTPLTTPLDRMGYERDQYEVCERSPLGHPLHIRLQPGAAGGLHEA